MRCGTPSYLAPELINGSGYGKSVDMWSCGVMLFVLVTGVLPFSGSDRDILFQKILRGVYEYPSLPIISEAVKDLISRLLRTDPMSRYSAREAAVHPWSQPEDPEHPSSPQNLDLDTVHEMMRSFNAERRWRRALHMVVAINRLLKVLPPSTKVVHTTQNETFHGDPLS